MCFLLGSHLGSICIHGACFIYSYRIPHWKTEPSNAGLFYRKLRSALQHHFFNTAYSHSPNRPRHCPMDFQDQFHVLLGDKRGDLLPSRHPSQLPDQSQGRQSVRRDGPEALCSIHARPRSLPKTDEPTVFRWHGGAENACHAKRHQTIDSDT